jgi:hypothetical protein
MATICWKRRSTIYNRYVVNQVSDFLIICSNIPTAHFLDRGLLLTPKLQKTWVRSDKTDAITCKVLQSLWLLGYPWRLFRRWLRLCSVGHSHNPLLLSSLMTYHLITMTYHRIVDISNKMGVASRAGIVQSSWSSDFTSVISGGLILYVFLSLFIWLYAFTVCLSTSVFLQFIGAVVAVIVISAYHN